MQHGIEMLERAGRRKAKDRARGDRLGRESVRRREAGVGKLLGGEQSDQPVERQAMHPEHRAAGYRERAHEIVSSLFDRRDHEDLARSRLRLEPRAGGRDAITGAFVDYDFTRSSHRTRRDSMPRDISIVVPDDRFSPTAPPRSFLNTPTLVTGSGG